MIASATKCPGRHSKRPGASIVSMAAESRANSANCRFRDVLTPGANRQVRGVFGQNVTRRPSCIRRGPTRVLVIRPKLGLLVLRLAEPNWV